MKGNFLNLSSSSSEVGNRPKLILIPPPNVTGNLHLGHYLELHLVDFGILNARDIGFKVFALGGYDHAGYSSESQVARDLDKVEKFKLLGRRSRGNVLAFKRQKIAGNLNRENLIEYFSLDDSFIALTSLSYDNLLARGLAYKGHHFLNLRLSDFNLLADSEVSSLEVEKKLYHIRYKASRIGIRDLVIATTQPLTMLSDVALCVNPRDPRYGDLIGQEFSIPLSDKKIKLLCHDFVKATYGTGVVKLTPLYDKKDALICRELGLDFGLHFVTEDGFREEGKASYQEEEERLVEDLKREGSLISIEITKGRSNYCSKSLEQGRFERVLDFNSFEILIDLPKIYRENARLFDSLEVHPSGCKNELDKGLSRLEPGCVSRNLIWGVPLGEGKVLDTGFNASLGPLLAPSADVIEVLICGGDIMFFGYLKMSLIHHALKGKLPFKRVYFHPLITDSKGVKMSKSKGNVVDPDQIHKKGKQWEIRLNLLRNGNSDKYSSLDFQDSGFKKLSSRLFFISKFHDSGRSYEDMGENLAWLSYQRGDFLVGRVRNFKSCLHQLRFFKAYEVLDLIVKTMVEDLQDSQGRKSVESLVQGRFLLKTTSSILSSLALLDTSKKNLKANISCLRNGRPNLKDECLYNDMKRIFECFKFTSYRLFGKNDLESEKSVKLKVRGRIFYLKDR